MPWPWWASFAKTTVTKNVEVAGEFANIDVNSLVSPCLLILMIQLAAGHFVQQAFHQIDKVYGTSNCVANNIKQ